MGRGSGRLRSDARQGQTVTDTELDSLCLSAIARFKRPRAYVFLDTLPKNNYGKVLKTELRQSSVTQTRDLIR